MLHYRLIEKIDEGGMGVERWAFSESLTDHLIEGLEKAGLKNEKRGTRSVGAGGA